MELCRPKEEYWVCIIGPADLSGKGGSMDWPMREAAQKTFKRVIGSDADECISGWGVTPEGKKLINEAWSSQPDWLKELNPPTKETKEQEQEQEEERIYNPVSTIHSERKLHYYITCEECGVIQDSDSHTEEEAIDAAHCDNWAITLSGRAFCPDCLE